MDKKSEQLAIYDKKSIIELINELKGLDDDVLFKLKENISSLSTLLKALAKYDNIAEYLNSIDQKMFSFEKLKKTLSPALLVSMLLVGFLSGILLSLFPMSSKLYDYYEKEFTEALNKTSFRIENLKKKNAQTLAALEAEHAKEIEKLKNDFFQKNAELEFQAVEAKRRLEQFKSNSTLAVKLQEADVKIDYSLNPGDGFVTLSIDRDSVRHIPISRDNKLVFKPREKF